MTFKTLDDLLAFWNLTVYCTKHFLNCHFLYSLTPWRHSNLPRNFTWLFHLTVNNHTRSYIKFLMRFVTLRRKMLILFRNRSIKISLTTSIGSSMLQLQLIEYFFGNMRHSSGALRKRDDIFSHPLSETINPI